MSGLFPITHNLHAKAIRISARCLSCVFQSDKTSKFTRAIRHRQVPWSKLPLNSNEIVDAYIAARPPAQTYLCKEDVQPLSRTDVLNMIDVYVLQTDWGNLHVMPHGFFRQGCYSKEGLAGIDISTIEHECRWVQN